MTDPAACLSALLSAPLTLRLYSEHEGEHYQEPTHGGYAAAELPRKSWEQEAGKARGPEHAFGFSDRAGLIRGWFLTHGDEVLASGAFGDGPYSIGVRGGVIRVRPEITLTAE